MGGRHFHARRIRWHLPRSPPVKICERLRLSSLGWSTSPSRYHTGLVSLQPAPIPDTGLPVVLPRTLPRLDFALARVDMPRWIHFAFEGQGCGEMYHPAPACDNARQLHGPASWPSSMAEPVASALSLRADRCQPSSRLIGAAAAGWARMQCWRGGGGIIRRRRRCFAARYSTLQCVISS